MSGEDEQVYQLVEEIVRKQGDLSSKEKLLEIYSSLFRVIWRYVQPTIGRDVLQVIAERALSLARERHPLLDGLQIVEEGPSLRQWAQALEEEPLEALHAACSELMANLLHILAMLTGNILLDQLAAKIDGDRD